MNKSSFFESMGKILIFGQKLMIDVLNFFNTYDGLVVAIATGVIAWLTYQLVRENRILRRIGTEPEIIAYLIPDSKVPSVVNFVIENVGMGVAKDISFSMKYDEAEFADHGVILKDDPNRAQFSFLPAKEKIILLFGVGHWIAKGKSDEEWLKPFDVILKYQDIKNKKYERKYTLDFSSYKGLAGQASDPKIEKISNKITSIDKSLKDIRDLYRQSLLPKASDKPDEGSS